MAHDVVVTGIGLLGSRLMPLLFSQGYEPIGIDMATDVDPVKGEVRQIDITDLKALETFFKAERPQVVFHTAALTNVDKNETDPDLAHKVNVLGTKNIGLAAKKVKATVIYVSTDFVFDGKKGMYKETDKPNPVSVYGKTKLESEKELTATGVEHAIVRTAVLYGSYRLRFNFATWVIDSLRAKKPMTLVTDQYNSPTLADDLAVVLLEIYESKKRELFHTGGSERINRYDFGLKIAKVMGLDPSPISPITTDKLDMKAKRPPDGSLDVSKVKKVIGHKMLSIDEGLAIVKEQELRSGPKGKIDAKTIKERK
jgi:dTDP-4-dehydrorhamnose reductase